MRAVDDVNGEQEPLSAFHMCPCTPGCMCRMDESCLGCVQYEEWRITQVVKMEDSQ